MGFDPSALLNNTSQGAATSLVSGAIGQGFSALSAARDWKYAKKLMAKQHAYELENLAAQDKYQRQLAVDASSLRKRSLQNAGYSTADPEGTGTVAPTVSAPSSSASGMSISQTPTFAPGMTVTDLANANLMNSQADLNKIEAKWRAQKLEGEVGKLNAEIKSILEKLPLEKDQLQKDIDLKLSQQDVNKETAARIHEEIDKVFEETKGIKIDNQFRFDMKAEELAKLKNEVNILIKEGRIKELEATLADKGVLVNSNWFATLASIVLSGSTGQVLGDISSSITTIISQFPDMLGSLFTDIYNMIADLPEKVLQQINKGANKKVRAAAKATKKAINKGVQKAKEGVGWLKDKTGIE